MQKQTIPENSNEQTSVCLTGTVCTMAAFNDPTQNRKVALFAFGSVTTLQENLRVLGDCDSGSKFSSCYAAPFVVWNHLGETHKHKCEQNCRFPPLSLRPSIARPTAKIMAF